MDMHTLLHLVRNAPVDSSADQTVNHPHSKHLDLERLTNEWIDLPLATPTSINILNLPPVLTSCGIEIQRHKALQVSCRH